LPAIIKILKIVAVLIAAVLIGNWFMSEFRKAQAGGKPWYYAYLSPPGLLILAVIIILPLIIWFLER